MINNQDAGDISGLEEVFRSQEFGRASGTAADGPAGVGLSVRRGEGILGTRFGHRPAAAPGLRTGDDTGSRRTSDAVGSPVARADEASGAKQPSSVPASGARRRTREAARRRSFCVGEDTPAGTGRLLRSARSSRSSRQVSRPVRVSTRRRMSLHKDDTGGHSPVVGSTPPVRRQRAWRLRVACSQTLPVPPALRRSRARTADLVLATRPVDTSPLLGLRPSPALRARKRRRQAASRAGVAGLRVRRRPRAPIRRLPSGPPSGAR